MQDNIMDLISKEIKCILISDNSEEVSEAWNKLEECSTDDCNDINYSKLLKSILKGNNIKNINEVPQLLQWFTKFPCPNTASDPISDYVAQFLLDSAQLFKSKPCLAEILQVMYDSRTVYLPQHNCHKNLAIAIVNVLSWMYIPTNHLALTKKFMDDLAKILEFLKELCKSANNEETELRFVCFRVLLNVVLTSNREKFGYGLVIVLQLIDDKLWRVFMGTPVQEILVIVKDEVKITNMLCSFCEWIIQTINMFPSPPYMKHLSMWLTIFFKTLKKCSLRRIVMDVAEASLFDIYFKLLMSNTFNTIDIEDNVIFVLLLEIRSLDLHHRIMRETYRFFNLCKNKSIEQKKVIDRLVDCMTVLTTRFQQHLHNNTYNSGCPICNPMIKFLFHYGQSKDINQCGSLDIPEESEEIIMEVAYPSTSTGVGRVTTSKVGLLNLGNTCYMNSVLQALAMTRQFCHEVLLYKSTNDFIDQTVLKNLQNLFALLKYSSRNALAPTEILQASRPSYFMPGQQQDSSEFLCHLLDVLYEQEKSALMPSSTSDNSISTKSKAEDKEMDVEEATGATTSPVNDDDTSPNMVRWTTEENLSEGASLQRKTQSLADFTQGEELAQTQNGLSDSHSDSTDSGIQSVGGEDSSSSSASSAAASPSPSSYLVHRVFGGELKVIYQCLKCGNESHNTDRFRDLQLCFIDNLEQGKTTTVQDLINVNYFSPETLTGDNKYRCDKCAELCDAQRIIKVLQAPVHLILTLKHFRYDSESRLRTKLRRRVQYDETIKLPVLEQDNEIYQLYAAVVHSGYNMDYGHYITYACDSKNRWYKFNDSYVMETTLNDFKRLEPPDTPYILFYKRRGNELEDDEPELMRLPQSVQEYVEHDRRRYDDERRNSRMHMGQITRYNPRNTWDRDKNDDNDGQPPPSSCRESISIPYTNFLC